MDAGVGYHQTKSQLGQELEVIQASKINPVHFEVLYNKYYPQIFKYVKIRVEDMQAAYDITAQVFLKALKNIHRYEYRGVPFSSWLYRIAQSETYQSFRDEKSQRIVNIDVSDLKNIVGDSVDRYDQEEDFRKMANAIKKLKQNELCLIEMRFFEKRSFKEIGEILYITENNAKVRCFRILTKLRELMTSIVFLTLAIQ